MFCPQCGERALAARQRYCHACGAMMVRRSDVTQNNLVSDDSARAVVTLSALALSWARDNMVRLLLVGSGIAVAVMVATAIAMVLLCVAIATAAVVTPLLLFIAAFWLVAWRRRQWVRL
jgi:uncharacterized membrane protein YvbJ